MKKLLNRRGFTLLETLIAIAVVVVLTGIAVPAIVNTNATLTTQQENDYAKSIFLAAQNNLVSLETNGGINSLEAEIPEDATIYTESGSDLKDDIKTALSTRAETLKAGDTEKQYVYVEKGKYDEPGELFKKILPEDSIDSSILSGKKVTIIFNPVSGDIYCVKYGDNGEYFGSVVSYDKSKITVTPTVSLVNGEENLVYIKVPVPDEFLSGAESYLNAITFTITVTDAGNSGNSFTYTLNSTSKSNGFDMNYVTHVATWAVDSLVTGRSFSDRNNNATEKTGSSITAGSDICVSVDYTISDDAEYEDVEFDLSNSAPEDPVNSLYASCEGNTITVSNGRHLQNLNNIDNTLASSVTKVQLGTSIYWGETVKHYSSLSGNLTYYSTGESSLKRFVPLKAEKLFADGSAVTVDGCSNTIHNLYVYGLDDDAGMFENLLVSVSNLTLADPIVKGGGNAGALAATCGYVESGTRKNNVVISNCHVVLENDSVRADDSVLNGSNPVDGNTGDFYGACSVKKNSVGQLVGAAYSITISNSSVNTNNCDVPASGVNFGLIAGYTENCIIEGVSAKGYITGGCAANIGAIAGIAAGNNTSIAASTADGIISNIIKTDYDQQAYPCIGGAVGCIQAGAFNSVSAKVQISNVISEDSTEDTSSDRTHKCPAGLGTVGKFVGYINNLSEGTDGTICSSPVSFLSCSGIGAADYDYQFLGVVDYVKTTSTGEFYQSGSKNESVSGIVADYNNTSGSYIARDGSGLTIKKVKEIVYYNYPDIVMADDEGTENTYINGQNETKIQYIISDNSYLYDISVSDEYPLEKVSAFENGKTYLITGNDKLLIANSNDNLTTIEKTFNTEALTPEEYNTYKNYLWLWNDYTSDKGLLQYVSNEKYMYINASFASIGFQNEPVALKSYLKLLGGLYLSYETNAAGDIAIFRRQTFTFLVDDRTVSFSMQNLNSNKTPKLEVQVNGADFSSGCFLQIYSVPTSPSDRNTFKYNSPQTSQCIGSK